ncbi:hypothetical protein BB559_001262 [Furculomyces boomerangus]|uniref:VPS37 C-terminal domain-containing protein n=2 Tax=Harpellales TaxID=61421 RepID=A0A2T9Z2I4_9FUNG|nr:hypothetical protein BB559_001262 [Furculomyces boomerangus]PWA01893.1 hypothetical protein BB558_002019 [Smittium angustum]PWA02338.1 hypothetical protein BB558_001521 [Smittium angustum]
MDEQMNSKGLPEPMNNYNLPPPDELEQKLRILNDYYPTFANKGADDLEDLLKYNDLFQTHFDGLEQVQMTRTLQYELRQQSLALAKKNLESKETLEELRNQVEKKSAVLDSLTTSFYQLSSKMVNLQRSYSAKNQLNKLVSKMGELENESENLIEKFLVGNNQGQTLSDSELESLLRDFVTVRTKYHELEAKQELINNNKLE